MCFLKMIFDENGHHFMTSPKKFWLTKVFKSIFPHTLLKTHKAPLKLLRNFTFSGLKLKVSPNRTEKLNRFENEFHILPACHVSLNSTTISSDGCLFCANTHFIETIDWRALQTCLCYGEWSAFKQEERHNWKAIIIVGIMKLAFELPSLPTPANVQWGEFNDRSTI